MFSIHYIICFLISLNLFFFSYVGIIISKKNLLLILICIELMLISVQLNFLITSVFFNTIFGQIFVLLILMVAAAEIAIGLALLILNYRLKGHIETKFLYLTKG